ncbi:hypothetical protein JRQ81_007123 [Phrynocephalus forsythii]|uniref:Uncharacterized protein n=1 Tax=Phrynocephalus forsythii TaxID=171643 RepID=A0A9Q0XDK2_9SAUR|nr:hypothetical protein JRQ81_007123 [Phrynocephalus forsythii]
MRVRGTLGELTNGKTLREVGGGDDSCWGPKAPPLLLSCRRHVGFCWSDDAMMRQTTGDRASPTSDEE